MIWNYFKIAWRTLTNNRVYSIINLLGLTIGIWACMSVATVVINDLTYDTHWSNAEDLYRIITVKSTGSGQSNRMASSFAGLNPVLKNDFPEVEAVSNFSTRKIHFKLSNSGTDQVEINLLNTDTTVWEMLDFKILSGDPLNYIHDKKNLIITLSMKNKFFPHEDPVGKIISDIPSYSAEPNSYVITGVIEDIPSNTHLRADAILVEKGRLEVLNKEQFGTFQQNYVLLKPGTDPAQFASKLSNWYGDFVEAANADSFEFQPVKDIYLKSDFAEYQEVKGSLTNIYILSGVALLLLIIACVNFINLSTARAIKRMREIGVRKILGANRRQLVIQFLIESVLFFLISAFIATFLYNLTVPLIENYLGHALEKTFLSGFYLFGITILILITISLLAGGYPALVMSSYNPAETIKGNFHSGGLSGQNVIRKSLVVLQFSISIIVLVALLVVQQQVTFLKNKDIGYNENNLLSIGTVSWDGKGEAFKNEILKLAGVQKASITSWLPTLGPGNMSRVIENPGFPEKELTVWYINADTDLATTLELKLEKGRFLDENFSSDILSFDYHFKMDQKTIDSIGRQSSLITSNTAKILQIHALDSLVKTINTTPVGIVGDFHNESLKNSIQPTIIKAEKSPQYGGMLVRVNPGTEGMVTESINKTWKQFYPNKLLEVNRVEEMVAAQYAAESKLQKLFAFFSGLSMFLAAMGVFGLIVQITEQQVKEIGIRKVLGASVQSIVLLFSKSFLKIVAVAIIIASPIAWYAMHNWLQNFAYRVDIGWWVFALAGTLSLGIAILTVSFQALKAATSNPIKNLRTE